jgi:hypothetical protein
MKKFLLSFFIVSVGSICLSVFTGDAYLHSNTGGSPSASGCSCHSATNQNDAATFIRVEDNQGNAVTSYTPGTTYKIIFGTAKTGKVKFGFAFSADQGTLANTPGNTKTQKSGNYLTHTSSGTASTVTDSAKWEANWTAPATATSATLNVIVNATNNNNNDDAGDLIYSKSVTLTKSSNTGIAESGIAMLSIFPSPARSFVYVNYELKQGNNVMISLKDLQGKIVSTLLNENVLAGKQEHKFNFESNISSSFYFIEIKAGAFVKTQKILIQ